MPYNSTAMRFILFLLFSVIASAEIDNDAAVEMPALASEYGFDVYECDGNLEALDHDNKQKKGQVGQVYRVCLRPNSITSEADVGIANVNSWKWTFDDQVQQAVIDGQGVGGIAMVQCFDAGKVCALDTMLIASFYDNPGTVFGEGTVSFTSGTGNATGSIDLFKHKFKFKWIGADGEAMSDEEVAEMIKNVHEHNEAVTAADTDEEVSNDELAAEQDEAVKAADTDEEVSNDELAAEQDETVKAADADEEATNDEL